MVRPPATLLQDIEQFLLRICQETFLPTFEMWSQFWYGWVIPGLVFDVIPRHHHVVLRGTDKVALMEVAAGINLWNSAGTWSTYSMCVPALIAMFNAGWDPSDSVVDHNVRGPPLALSRNEHVADVFLTSGKAKITDLCLLRAHNGAVLLFLLRKRGEISATLLSALLEEEDCRGFHGAILEFLRTSPHMSLSCR
jgi:hypothetical protein